MTSPGWSTRHLAEFLEAISAVGDVASARRVAVDRVAEALQAELAAVVSDRGIEVAIGPDPEHVSATALAAVREGRSMTAPRTACCKGFPGSVPGPCSASASTGVATPIRCRPATSVT